MLIDDIAIGHFTNKQAMTGLSVFLFEQPVRCGYFLAGCAPASRDVHLLETWVTVDAIHGLMLSGGSAFGLGAANGVMRWLNEQGRGFPVFGAIVPIVPAACIYDLDNQSIQFPTEENAYQACCSAKKANLERGRIGAGTGAMVGKLFSNQNCMSGGFGIAQLQANNGVEVLACAVVNSLGDVVNENGSIVAGARNEKNEFLNIKEKILAGNLGRFTSNESTRGANTNTTLAAIFTNAKADKGMLTRIAKMASAGFAKAIVPSFTSLDGDMIFCCSLGELNANEIQIGSMAAEAVRQAIVNAVSAQ